MINAESSIVTLREGKLNLVFVVRKSSVVILELGVGRFLGRGKKIRIAFFFTWEFFTDPSV